VDQAGLSLASIADNRSGLFEHAPDAMLIVDSSGIIRLVNGKAEWLFGYFREELIGRPVELLIPERHRANHVGERTGYTTDPHVRPMGTGLELVGLRKDGGEFSVEISLIPVVAREGAFVASVIRDLSKTQGLRAASSQAAFQT
jgi:PAS domain S-box-containing protein